jgi:hypothetical protein
LTQPNFLFSRNPWQLWLKKNDSRAEGLLKFVRLTLPLEMIRVQAPIPPHTLLWDLPSYCYDMHTRVGLEVLRRLVRGVSGAEEIERLIQHNQVKSLQKALGGALFRAEGGRLKWELIYEALSALEQRLFAQQYGLSPGSWLIGRICSCLQSPLSF